MHDFIENVSSRLGISNEQAQLAAGSLMQMLGQHMNPQDHQQLKQQLPGSEEMIQQASGAQAQEQAPAQSQQQQAPAQPPQQAGGGLGGMLGSLAGGAGGGIGNIISMFSKSGLKENQVNSFVTMFLDYVRQKAGGGMLDKILQQVPGLNALAPMAGSTR
ncbi:MAG: DUF2780 domain-containing protein [Bacteroidota bacterium]